MDQFVGKNSWLYLQQRYFLLYLWGMLSIDTKGSIFGTYFYSQVTTFNFSSVKTHVTTLCRAVSKSMSYSSVIFCAISEMVDSPSQSSNICSAVSFKVCSTARTVSTTIPLSDMGFYSSDFFTCIGSPILLPPYVWYLDRAASLVSTAFMASSIMSSFVSSEVSITGDATGLNS